MIKEITETNKFLASLEQAYTDITHRYCEYNGRFGVLLDTMHLKDSPDDYNQPQRVFELAKSTLVRVQMECDSRARIILEGICDNEIHKFCIFDNSIEVLEDELIMVAKDDIYNPKVSHNPLLKFAYVKKVCIDTLLGYVGFAKEIDTSCSKLYIHSDNTNLNDMPNWLYYLIDAPIFIIGMVLIVLFIVTHSVISLPCLIIGILTVIASVAIPMLGISQKDTYNSKQLIEDWISLDTEIAEILSIMDNSEDSPKEITELSCS